MHRLLQRQITRHLGPNAEIAGPLANFVAAVNDAYSQFDSDRTISERSMEMASTELMERNRDLQKAKAELEERVLERTTEVRQINEQLLSDIAERKATEERLRESQERYELAVHGANDGIWDWDLRNASTYYSPRWISMLGHHDGEIAADPAAWFDRVHPEDKKTLDAAISAHLEGLTSHFEIEHRMRHQDGTYRWMLCRGIAQLDASGKAFRLAGSQSDITERKEAEGQLLRAAFNDALTGLPNRALFTDRLERAILRTKRAEKYRFAVLFMDLDRFKVINDSLGHLAGDQLLILFAQRLGVCLREADTLSRLGGDEFTMLLEDIGNNDAALVIAERIRDVLKKPFNIAGHEVFTSASIGIAVSDGTYDRAQDILRDADTAMYRAKAQGKARHQLFDSGMHAGAVKRLQLENDLRRAIDRNELTVFYQPIMPCQGQIISGMEALVRWRHPERGLISPADFIPVAEETGLIIELGEFVLFEACRQMREWHDMFDPGRRPFVAVNLSVKQFGQHDLVERVTATLHRAGLDPRFLVLEITESIIMEHPEIAANMLGRLKAMGVRIDIDDFGTGYSSLGYLKHFPADTMKIDRSFVSGMFQNGENAEIIRTIISLAHSLNMSVTAEGIETSQQLDALRSLGCEHAQGFFFSKPIEASAATRLLLEGVEATTKKVA